MQTTNISLYHVNEYFIQVLCVSIKLLLGELVHTCEEKFVARTIDKDAEDKVALVCVFRVLVHSLRTTNFSVC